MNKIITAILFLLFTSTSTLADPIALRNNVTDKNTYGISLGWKENSVGMWLNPSLGFSAEIALPFDYISASVATKKTFLGGEQGFGLDGFISGGLTVKTVDFGLAININPAMKVRYKGESFAFTAGIISPAMFEPYNKFQVRIPAMLELSFLKGFNENRFNIGLQTSGGVVFVPGILPSVALQGSLLFNFL